MKALPCGSAVGAEHRQVCACSSDRCLEEMLHLRKADDDDDDGATLQQEVLKILPLTAGELGMAAPWQPDPRPSYVFPSRHSWEVFSSDRKSLHTLLDTVKRVHFPNKTTTSGKPG